MRKKLAALLVLGILAIGGLGYAASQRGTGTNCCGHCEMMKK